METYGKLKVRVFIATQKPDEHGRLRGGWRTLMACWIDREDIEQRLQVFSEANPELLLPRHRLNVTFDITEELSI
jgi:hypothetical protein